MYLSLWGERESFVCDRNFQVCAGLEYDSLLYNFLSY